MALHKPNGITLNSSNLALLWRLSFVCPRVRLRPALRSRLENHLDPASWSKDPSILGKGYASLTVMSVRRLYSIQKRLVPSIFLTSTMALARGLAEVCILLCWSIRSSCLFTSCCICTGTKRIGCLTEIQPIFLLDYTNSAQVIFILVKYVSILSQEICYLLFLCRGHSFWCPLIKFS